jgi:single-strand DNA-binding protein
VLNKAIIMGRLTRDPEVRYTPNNTAVSTITVAVDRAFVRQGEERETDFIDVVCWANRADFVAKWFKKGSMIIVEGRIQTRKWKDKYDQNRVNFEIVAENLLFGETKASADSSAQYERSEQGYQNAYQPPQKSETSSKEYNFSTAPIADFKELADDDDVPF